MCGTANALCNQELGVQKTTCAMSNPNPTGLANGWIQLAYWQVNIAGSTTRVNPHMHYAFIST